VLGEFRGNAIHGPHASGPCPKVNEVLGLRRAFTAGRSRKNGIGKIEVPRVVDARKPTKFLSFQWEEEGFSNWKLLFGISVLSAFSVVKGLSCAGF